LTQKQKIIIWSLEVIMMEPPTLGLLAGIIGFLSFIPYILGTLNRKTKPNKATWIIWAVLGVIIAASYWAAGARETAWVPVAYAIGVIIIALLSLKYGEEGWTTLDKACLAGAGTGLALWYWSGDAALALYFTITVDAIGAAPTIKKAYERPESESRTAWLMYLVANTLNLFALSEWTLAAASYPVYVFALSAIMSALLSRRRRIIRA
jgi:hypothetical protein